MKPRGVDLVRWPFKGKGSRGWEQKRYLEIILNMAHLRLALFP